MCHLVLGQLRRCSKAHVALRAGVELVAARTLNDCCSHVLVLFCSFDLTARFQRVVHGGHVGNRDIVNWDFFAFLVDEAVARQARAVVELFATDVTWVNTPLPMEPQVTTQHPEWLK